MEKGIGEFIIDASPLVSVTGQLPDEEFIRKLNATYTVSRHRTIDQDAAFGIRQIVDVALKALTVIIELAMAASNPRAPAAPAPNSRGHCSLNDSRLLYESVSIKATARTTVPSTMSEGMNHRLERKTSQSCSSLFTKTPRRLDRGTRVACVGARSVCDGEAVAHAGRHLSFL